MFRRMLREYFSLTRGERQGLQILSLLVLLLVVFRVSLPILIHAEEPDFSGPGEDFIAFKDSLLLLDADTVVDREKSPALFPFNPNRIEFDDLIRLGMSPGTARTLLNYRKAGGRFDSDSDLLRIYGLQPEEFERLQAFIRIPQSPISNNEGTTAGFTGTGNNPHMSHSAREHPFELNSADSQTLVSVYGIGPVFARRIIRYRELLGGFWSSEQLLEVYGLSLQQYQELSRCSFLDTGQLRKINLNALEAGEIAAHPYLDPYQAAALAAYREQMGAFETEEEILENRLLPDSIYRKIRPYLETDR